MPHNLQKKKYKKKARSCPLCKPHKMGWGNAKTFQDKKADITFIEQIEK